MNNSMKMISGVKHLSPNGITFSLFSEEEVKTLSAARITTPMSFNVLGHPYKGGLYDPALGPISESSDPCATCLHRVLHCPGHFGHIELPLPAINPLFHKTIHNILKLACLNCHMLQVKGYMKHVYMTKLKLLNDGYFVESQGIDDVIAEFSAREESGWKGDSLETLIKEKLDDYYLKCLKAWEDEKETVKMPPKTRIIESQINNIINTMEKSRPDFKSCHNCSCSLKKIYLVRKKFMINVKKSEALNKQPIDTDRDRSVATVILPDELRTHLRKIWENEKEFVMALVPVLRNCSMENPTDALFFSVLPVPPPKMRPVNYVGNVMAEHPQSDAFKLIIQDAILLQTVIKAIQDSDTNEPSLESEAMLQRTNGKTLLEKINTIYDSLQTNINNLVDSQQSYAVGKRVNPGIKQIIEKKAGVIRMHMMGKRVDFAARTVITPDPCLGIEEIGIPEEFAKSLTYPVPVTNWNVAELRQMVLNGPLVYPGAVYVQSEDGTTKKISPDFKVQRQSLAKCLLTPGETHDASRKMKIVHRHLCNGDVLLLNRQPTLHKPGIMAHIARILKGEKTLRLHYANCKAYNADFDGDEMNAHFPQNEVARSEAYNLLNVKNQYVVPKDGTPLTGLIQDHVIAGVKLSVRGRFFDREDYQQLVYQALNYRRKAIKLLPPAILKPRVLWSGKQIMSTVIINIIPEKQYPLNLTSTAKISDKAWLAEKPRPWIAGGTPFTSEHSMSEAEVIIREGQLMCGVLDKTHYGATPYGLVHCMNELYGGSCSSSILSAFSKLFNAVLKCDGFTLGIEDILVVRGAEEDRKQFISEARQIGDKTAKLAVNLPSTASSQELNEKLEEVYENREKGRAIVDSSYKEVLDTYTNKINKACIPGGLLKSFPYNNLQLMIQSGAKGSTVNAMQISCLLGQIELEGRRPPHMMSGKNLPSFAEYDTSPRAGGFIDGRFMTGIKPQEFFFHCMAGREGLIDTAVKTSRSGYLQRCLVKHLEGLVVGYDTTVRDSDGSVIQFCYGEDGKDVLKAQFLKKKQMPFLAENCKAVINVTIDELEDKETSEQIKQRREEVRKWKKRYGDPLQKIRSSPFLKYSEEMRKSSRVKFRKTIRGTGRPKAADLICRTWQDADTESIERYVHESRRCPDPVTADFQVDRDFGAITEQLEKLMTDYLKERHMKHKTEFRQMLSVKSLQSSAHPGEPVGLLAAQSIGEPSTQMTLNTFHFAGRGEMNVTLGIPRLRELLMTASETIKTPYMDVPFLPNVPDVESKADDLRLKLCRVTLSDVLQHITVTDKLQVQPNRVHVYEIHMQFLPRKAYKSKFCVKPSDVLQYVERKFFKAFFSSQQKIWKLKTALLHLEDNKAGQRRATTNEEDEDDPGAELKEEGLTDGRKATTDMGEDHESSDEEQENDDDDATLARSKIKHMEGQEYEEPEEENEMLSEDEGIEEDEDEEKPKLNADHSLDGTNECQNYSNENFIALSEQKPDVKILKVNELRKSKVISSLPFITDYDYDTEKELWCRVKFSMPLKYRRLDLTSHLRDVVSKCVLWETPMIKRALTYNNSETQRLTLKTEGINFQEIFKFNELLDFNRIYSNDIHKMASTYGIEAARRVIVKEIQDVFKVYGIVVDPRHLLLVADYMTFNGKYQPFSRKGIEDNVSPLQQMSFEAPVTFLKSAVSRGKRDDLQSPSSRLIVGQPCVAGTGCFSLLYKLPTFKNLGL